MLLSIILGFIASTGGGYCSVMVGREGVAESRKKLKDYVGRNEKTKIVAKLQKVRLLPKICNQMSLICDFLFLRKVMPPPAREPVFSEDEQKKMMAHAYRKQEEFKV